MTRAKQDFLIGIGCVTGMVLGLAMLLDASSALLALPKPAPPLDAAQLRGMVSQASTFGWRCHEHGSSEVECSEAMLQVLEGKQ